MGQGQEYNDEMTNYLILLRFTVKVVHFFKCDRLHPITTYKSTNWFPRDPFLHHYALFNVGRIVFCNWHFVGTYNEIVFLCLPAYLLIHAVCS